MNHVAFIGNLCTEPEHKQIGDDNSVCSFVLAIDRIGVKPDAEQTADFVRISAWKKQAEACATYLTKGDRVAVEGRIRSRKWTADDGSTRTAVEVTANSVTFLKTKTNGNGNSSPDPDAELAAAMGDSPQNVDLTPEADEPATPESAQGATQPDTEDDIPF